jgi:hypothetical protein
MHMPELKPLHDAVLGNRARWEELQGNYKGFSRKTSLQPSTSSMSHAHGGWDEARQTFVCLTNLSITNS